MDNPEKLDMNSLLQTTGGKDEPNIVFMQKSSTDITTRKISMHITGIQCTTIRGKKPCVSANSTFFCLPSSFYCHFGQTQLKNQSSSCIKLIKRFVYFFKNVKGNTSIFFLGLIYIQLNRA
jgi:hypothetical protein